MPKNAANGLRGADDWRGWRVLDQGEWPTVVPIPQGTIEFDVEDAAEAISEMKSKGAEILQGTREEPRGQTTVCLLSPEGLLIGITYTPWLRS